MTPHLGKDSAQDHIRSASPALTVHVMDKLLVPCGKCASVNRLDLQGSRNASALPVCGACKTPLAVHGNVVEASGHGISNLLRATHSPVIIDFWAPWCAPCQFFAPVFEEAAAKFGDRFHFLKVNTDADPASGARFNVRGIPMLVALVNGSEIKRQSGAMPREMFSEWLSDIESRPGEFRHQRP